MYPKVVLHKRNGYRHPPADKGTLPGELIRLVHSDPARSERPSFDLVKFGSLVKSETPEGFAEQVAREIDAIRPALVDVIRDTQRALDRGELPDVRAFLLAWREQSELAARLVARLLAGRGGSYRAPSTQRRMVSLNELAAETLYILAPHLGAGLTVVTRLDAGLPRVVGSSNDLGRVLAALITCAAQLALTGGRAGTLVVETSRDEPAVHGDRVARVTVRADGPGLPDGLDLRGLARAAADHGGVVRAERGEGGGARFTLELPAV